MAPSGKKLQARVLFAVYGIAVGQIIEANKAVIDDLTKQGAVDPAKEAVEYARTQGGQVISYVSLEERRAAAQEALDTAQEQVNTITGQVSSESDPGKRNTLQGALNVATAQLSQAQAELAAVA